MRLLQRRPTNRVDAWVEGRYQRVFSAGGELVVVEVDNRGTIDRPDVRLSLRHGDEGAAARAGLGPIVRTVLGLDVDPAPIQRVAEAERALRPTAVALRGARPPRFPTLFEAFANVVPFQQVSLDAGAAVAGRLVERFGTYVAIDGRRLYAFPEAQRVAEAEPATLRACGLSTRRAEALQGIARLIASGELTARAIAAMGTLEARRALMTLPGIGPWSADLVLLRGFGRLDVFPAGDVGVARGLGALLHLAPGASLEPIAERFGDRRGYLYFCSLGASLLAKGLIHAAVTPPSGGGTL